jgi:hypothetical protein
MKRPQIMLAIQNDWIVLSLAVEPDPDRHVSLQESFAGGELGLMPV